MQLDDLVMRLVIGATGLGLLTVAVCRLRWMSVRSTRARVRHAAYAVLSAGALMLLAATIRPDWMRWAEIAGPLAALVWLASTSHAWREGQPPSAQRRSKKPLHYRPGPPRWDKTVPMVDPRREPRARP